MIRSLSVALALALLVPLTACDKADSSEKTAPEPTAKTGEAPTAKPAAGAGDTTKAGASLAEAGGSYTIDSAHTQALFKIKHLDVSYQYGMFTKVEGSFTLDSAAPEKSEIQISIPTESVFTAVKKRDDHLRSPDFFDAKQFPTLTFKSTSVSATGGNTYSVTGDLTMHGVTKPATLELQHVGGGKDPEMMGGAYRVGFNGEATIKRSEWNMNYMQGAGLGDEVTLLVSVEGTRK